MKLFSIRLEALLILILIISCTTTPKEPVSYLATPATEEEQAIASALETMITSYNEQDIEKHLSFYAPDARIESKLAGGFVTRDEYRETLKKRGRLPTIRLKGTKITKLSKNNYRVDTTLAGPGSSFYLIYDLALIEGKWLVIEQRYK